VSAINPHDQYQPIASRLHPLARVTHAAPLTGGLSAGMTLLNVALPDEKTRLLVVRSLPAGDLQRELRLLKWLKTVNFPTPQPVLADLSGELLGSPCLVLDYVEGEIRLELDGSTERALQAGAWLARLHSVQPPSELQENLPPVQTETRLAPGAVSLAAAAAPAAEFLSAGELPQPSHPALLHGDFWPGNWLWRSDRLAAVIDWEDAGMGHPLLDLACARLDLTWIHTPAAAAAFTHSYMNNLPVDGAWLPWFDLCAVLRLARMVADDLENWAGFFHQRGRTDITPGFIQEQVQAFALSAIRQIKR